VFLRCPGLQKLTILKVVTLKAPAMKAVCIVAGFLLLNTLVLPALAQQPTCQHPVGLWKAEDGGTITISSVDPSTGEIRGVYQLTSSAQNVSSPLTGWQSLPGGADSAALALSSGNVSSGHVVSWTGYCRMESNGPTLHLLSPQLHAEDSTQRSLTLMTTWTLVAATEPQHMALAKKLDGVPGTDIGSASCPLEGRTKSGGVPKANMIALNLFKNRTTEPASGDFDAQVTLAKMLNSKDDSDLFDQHTAATITGVIFGVKPEAGESCNCNSTDSVDWDYHIYIGTASAKSIFDCAVVEMTPYSRFIHPEWTLQYVKSLTGKKVQVTGWLLYDFEHKPQSFETNPNTKAPFRHTVWEIHPVTAVSLGAN
jgi:hypothetical protein